MNTKEERARGDYGSCAQIPMLANERERADEVAREMCDNGACDGKELLLARRILDLLTTHGPRPALGAPDPRATAKCGKCFDTGTVYESHGEAVNCEAPGCPEGERLSEQARLLDIIEEMGGDNPEASDNPYGRGFVKALTEVRDRIRAL